MRYSKLFGKTIRAAPSGTEALSHKLLVRGGFIDQLMAGVFSFLPLGWRVHQRIENIIREEMNAIGGQEVFLPTLQKKEQWLQTGRWEKYDPPLFKFKDRHGRELALGSTHEEVITDLARRFVASYRDLPLYVYQIQNKFRNEMRATGGLLRVREFVMKDLYSFHESAKDLAKYFKAVFKSYQKIYERCGLPAIASQALGGAIGGTTTYEFQVPSKVGEDKVLLCEACHLAINMEAAEKNECPECGGQKFRQVTAIEVGHIFNLGVEYSEKMGARFIDRRGVSKPIWMGCYGIGVGRLMAAVVETHHDKDGIIWPVAVTPHDIHLVSLDFEEEKVKKVSEALYTVMEKSGLDVLYDDRDESAGVKLKDADLVGIPVRVIVSKRSIKKGGVEFSRRDNKKSAVVGVDKLAGKIREVYG